MIKRPDRRFPTPQVDMSNVGLNAVLDEAIRAVEAPAELPTQLWDWYTDDWKIRFTAHASPYSPSAEDLYQYNAEEIADVRGVYIPLNLLDLATNPKKTMSKFVERSLNPLNPFGGDLLSGEFWTDLDTSVERDMWRDLVKPDSYLDKVRKNKVNIMTSKTHNTLAGTMGPINFEKQGVFQAGAMFSSLTGKNVDVTEGVDVYEQVGANVINFVAKKKSSLTREGAYSEMQSAFIQAASTELSNKYAGKISPLILGGPLDLEVSTRITGLGLESDIIGDLGELSEKMGGVQKAITKAGFTKPVTVGEMQAKMADLQSAVAQARLHITSAKGAYGRLPTELSRFNHDIAGLESYLLDLDTFSSLLAGRNPVEILGKFGEGEVILSRSAVLSSRFSNTRYGGGVSDQYIQAVGKRTFEGNNAIVNLVSGDPALNAQMSEGFKSLHTVYGFQKRVYLQEDGRDLIHAISKGEWSKNYIWVGQLRDRIQVFTPGYWTAKVMDRTRYFGLIYNPKVTALHPVFDKSPLIRDHYFTEKFTVGGIAYSGRFKGSEHLGSFYDAWSRVSAGQLVGANTGGVMAWASVNDQWKAYFDLLNGTPSATTEYWLGKGAAGVRNWTNLTTKNKDFVDTLVANGILTRNPATGLIDDTPQNRAVLNGLFNKIGHRKANAANLDPFAEKFGILQVYTSKLSIIQQKMYSKLGLKKLADPYIRLRTAASKKIADLAAKAITKLGFKAAVLALGAATGGLAELIAPLVEKLLQAIVSKVIDKTKAFVTAILKGDFMGELDKIMDDAMKSTEKVLTCGCLVPLALAFAVFMMMANIIVSISPVDRAKKAISAIADAIVVPHPDPIVPNGCVSASYTNSCVSYAIGDQDHSPCRHGDNGYWAAGSLCTLNIPYFAGNPARGPSGDLTSVCKSRNPLRDYFGYALDVVPSSPDTAWVYAPQVGGVTNWSLSISRIDEKACATCSEWIGCHVTLAGNDAAHTYRIFLLHLACTTVPPIWQTTIAPGESIAKLYNYAGGKHVHIEMMVDGHYVKPETYMCNM